MTRSLWKSHSCKGHKIQRKWSTSFKNLINWVLQVFKKLIVKNILFLNVLRSLVETYFGRVLKYSTCQPWLW